MDERKAGITTATWPIIDAELLSRTRRFAGGRARRARPWTASRKSVFRRSFARGAKKAWLIPLPTPLDGDLVLNATSRATGCTRSHSSRPTGAPSCAGRSGCRSAESAWPRESAGSASLFVRVTPSGAAGQVTVTSRDPEDATAMRACSRSVAILAAVVSVSSGSAGDGVEPGLSPTTCGSTVATSAARRRARPARGAATWCGAPAQADLRPNVVSGFPVHWIYAPPGGRAGPLLDLREPDADGRGDDRRLVAERGSDPRAAERPDPALVRPSARPLGPAPAAVERAARSRWKAAS